jgi:hypothetical protein
MWQSFILLMLPQSPNEGPASNFDYTRIKTIFFSNLTSECPSRQVVRLQRKLKLAETKYTFSQVFISSFKIPIYQSSANFSEWFRLKVKSRKSLISSYLQNPCFLNFGLREGGLQPGKPPPLLVSERIRMHRLNYRKCVVEVGSSLTRLKVVFYASLWY